MATSLRPGPAVRRRRAGETGSHRDARVRQAVAVVQALASPDDQLDKAVVYMRALRRAVIGFWYSAIEDLEASIPEAWSALRAEP